ncbi:hypothetical protein ST47_g10394 [Ascochyta rabiei]|uniref:DUF7587 domain-containing protein n=1 Tax=Didymella rabiei TaxID=5454 RepID=A0A162VFV4_DIDRA|nr:hypothetical protein ST47_g10394 [Ascochyta rabiei]
MQNSVNDIEGSIRGFTLSGNASESRKRERPSSIPNHLAYLQDSIQGLDQSTNTIVLQAQSVRDLADDAPAFGCIPIAEVISLHEQTRKLTGIISDLRTTIDKMTESIEISVIRQLNSLGNRTTDIEFCRPPIKQLLSHFDAEIKNIVHESFNISNDQSILLRVAEKCYEQSVNPSGVLHADHYFDPFEEAQQEWPYDPDFESEEYYEHENRLILDDGYAADFQAQAERRSEASQKDRQDWVDFWVRALNHAPGGPTLFHPPVGLHERSLSLDVPKYLFRTFDAVSPGRNDDSIIASRASIVGSENSGQRDILGVEKRRAAKLLHMHLDKYVFGCEEQDNLMSWTSSLLFAIQYAIWRSYNNGRSTSKINICAVDPCKFPLGQFMRDVPLLETFHATAEQLGNPMENIFLREC